MHLWSSHWYEVGGIQWREGDVMNQISALTGSKSDKSCVCCLCLALNADQNMATRCFWSRLIGFLNKKILILFVMVAYLNVNIDIYS